MYSSEAATTSAIDSNAGLPAEARRSTMARRIRAEHFDLDFIRDSAHAADARSDFFRGPAVIVRPDLPGQLDHSPMNRHDDASLIQTGIPIQLAFDVLAYRGIGIHRDDPVTVPRSQFAIRQ